MSQRGNISRSDLSTINFIRDFMMEIFKVRQLGLAAYIKMKGAILIKYDSGFFTFESTKSLDDWNVEYTNSCCSLHDSELCKLRRIKGDS